MITKKKIEHRQRTKKHIRLHMAGSAERPRLTVFRSLKHVYAQLVDDDQGKTLVGVSDLTEELVEQAKAAKAVRWQPAGRSPPLPVVSWRWRCAGKGARPS